jgi:quercetin dioxygenase-like cupin family protein
VLQYLSWKTVAKENLNPLFDRQLIVGEKIMVARISLKKGAHVPLHSHFNEQITQTITGTLKFHIDGKDIVVGPGEILCIPPNMPHEAWALEDCVEVDTFTPPREDWLNKTDAYLRGERKK